MVSRLLTCGTVLLICLAAPGLARSAVVGSASTPRTVSRMTQCWFNPDGYFYMKGSSPEGFDDFDHIKILTSTGRVKRPASDSSFYTRDGKVYKFTKLTRSGAHSSGWGIVFEFETETIGAVRYKFGGRFFRICNFPEDETDPERPVAEGRITKFRDDKEVGTAEVQFTYSKAQRPHPEGQKSVRYPQDARDIIAFAEAFSRVDFSVKDATKNLGTVNRAKGNDKFSGQDGSFLLTPFPSNQTTIKKVVLDIFESKPDRVNIEYIKPVSISYGELKDKYGSPSYINPPVYKCKPGMDCRPSFVGYSFSFVPEQESMTSGKRLKVVVDLKMQSSKVVPQHTDKDFLAIEAIRFRRI